MSAIIYRTEFACPLCNERSVHDMRHHERVAFIACPVCFRLIPATEGACCVFCAYASVPCPDAQQRRSPRDRPH